MLSIYECAFPCLIWLDSENIIGFCCPRKGTQSDLVISQDPQWMRWSSGSRPGAVTFWERILADMCIHSVKDQKKRKSALCLQIKINTANSTRTRITQGHSWIHFFPSPALIFCCNWTLSRKLFFFVHTRSLTRFSCFSPHLLPRNILSETESRRRVLLVMSEIWLGIYLENASKIIIENSLLWYHVTPSCLHIGCLFLSGVLRNCGLIKSPVGADLGFFSIPRSTLRTVFNVYFHFIFNFFLFLVCMLFS